MTSVAWFALPVRGLALRVSAAADGVSHVRGHNAGCAQSASPGLCCLIRLCGYWNRHPLHALGDSDRACLRFVVRPLKDGQGEANDRLFDGVTSRFEERRHALPPENLVGSR